MWHCGQQCVNRHVRHLHSGLLTAARQPKRKCLRDDPKLTSTTLVCDAYSPLQELCPGVCTAWYWPVGPTTFTQVACMALPTSLPTLGKPPSSEGIHDGCQFPSSHPSFYALVIASTGVGQGRHFTVPPPPPTSYVLPLKTCLLASIQLPGQAEISEPELPAFRPQLLRQPWQR